jgi:hypothetical protein
MRGDGGRGGRGGDGQTITRNNMVGGCVCGGEAVCPILPTVLKGYR